MSSNESDWTYIPSPDVGKEEVEPNPMGYYTQAWVNRRTRRALKRSFAVYAYYYKQSWQRWRKSFGAQGPFEGIMTIEYDKGD